MIGPARPLWHGRVLALLGILLVAVNLRTGVGSISPITHLISGDLGLDPIVLGIIGATPPLAFALSGLISPILARRVGLEAAILIAVIAMVVGHLGRALAPTGWLLVVATAIAVLGAGAGNVLLPPLVKRYFPDRQGLATALYVTIMSLGATLPAVIAVPVADSAGWRGSLGIWAAASLVAAIPWIVQLARHRALGNPAAEADRALAADEPALAARIVRSPIAWAIAGMFGASAIGAYAIFAWFPPLLVDIAGVTPAQAGLLLGLFAIMGFPCALLVPLLAVRPRAVRPLIIVGLLLFVAGYLGMLLAPGAAPALWMVLLGLGPLIFPLALLLINLRSRTQAGSVALSGFVQGVGYVIGAVGPFVVGLLHAATGGWNWPLLFLLAALVLGIPAVFVLGRPRFVEDELLDYASGTSSARWINAAAPISGPSPDSPEGTTRTARM